MGVLVTNPHPGMLGGMKEGGRCFLETAGGRGVGVQRHAHPRRPGGPVPHPPLPRPFPPPRARDHPGPPAPATPPYPRFRNNFRGGTHAPCISFHTPPLPRTPPPQAVRPKHREPGTKTQAGWDTCLLGVRGSLAWGVTATPADPLAVFQPALR